MSTRKSFFRESWITYVHYGRDGEMVDDWDFLALHGAPNAQCPNAPMPQLSQLSAPMPQTPQSSSAPMPNAQMRKCPKCQNAQCPMPNAPPCVTGATGVGRYDAAWPKIEAEWYMGATACEKVQAD